MRKPLYILLAAVLLDCLMIMGRLIYDHFFVQVQKPFLGVAMLIVFYVMIVVPGILTFQRRWDLNFTPADWFLAGCLCCFLLGLFYGANTTFDFQLHDTYFIIANLHLGVAVGLVFAWIAIIYYLFPIIAGRRLNVTLGAIHFWVSLAGGYLLFQFGSMPYRGLAVMPRRYWDYSSWHQFDRYLGNDDRLLWWTLLVLAAQVVFLINLVYSGVKGRRV